MQHLLSFFHHYSHYHFQCIYRVISSKQSFPLSPQTHIWILSFECYRKFTFYFFTFKCCLKWSVDILIFSNYTLLSCLIFSCRVEVVKFSIPNSSNLNRSSRRDTLTLIVTLIYLGKIIFQFFLDHPLLSSLLSWKKLMMVLKSSPHCRNAEPKLCKSCIVESNKVFFCSCFESCLPLVVLLVFLFDVATDLPPGFHLHFPLSMELEKGTIWYYLFGWRGSCYWCFFFTPSFVIYLVGGSR